MRNEIPRPNGFDFDSFMAQIDSVLPSSDGTTTVLPDHEAVASGSENGSELSAKQANLVSPLSKVVFGSLTPHI